MESASVFTGKSQAEAIKAIQETASKHLLMFNYRGDGNGRHNLPGRPMLDDVTGVLFVLGIALSLWRWRRPRPSHSPRLAGYHVGRRHLLRGL